MPSPSDVTAAQIGAFRPVPRTGVIYVTTEAVRCGYDPSDPQWCNLGQGQPDAGELPGAPARRSEISVKPVDNDYAPISGLWELREAIADLYNQLYRRGMPSRYSAENVAVCGGGRVALTRAAAALGPINMGHFLPDYTGYEELLGMFRAFSPIPILLEPERGYAFTVNELRREIVGRGMAALLFSNPCNPTGKVIGGEELAQWVACGRELDCTLLVDEFYSHFVWRPDVVADGGMLSAARYVEDVESDPVVIFDGLTKNWRYPGWRLSWTLGPRQVIEAITSAGSFLDGGASRPLQRAAIDLLTVDHTRAETAAIHQEFGKKRQRLLGQARDLGMEIDTPAEGTFYVWASVAHLPEPIADGMGFFREALKRQVITVPGEFFGVDPGRRRGRQPSHFRPYVRLSFGPAQEVLDKAMARIAELVDDAAAHRL